MATTIQIKRGTGSAVPSNLLDGELAINLDNGKLYFGSGSNSVNSFRFENLTAENYIVSSSVTNLTTQELSGSTAFGDSADDTHTFTGAITASGGISSSGANSTFGEVVNLVGEDPRLRLKAVGANHPGIEWHEDSTRKWVVYNDPDESDNLTFKNDSTELIKISQSGDLLIPRKLIHEGDSNTFINFTDDDINITVGGINMLDFTEDSNDEITFNESAQDLDVRIEGEADANLLFTDASVSKVGIGTNSPGEKLEVVGNISASGEIRGKMLQPILCNFKVALNGDEFFLPLSEGENEKSSHTNVAVPYLAPYNGTLHKVLVRNAGDSNTHAYSCSLYTMDIGDSTKDLQAQIIKQADRFGSGGGDSGAHLIDDFMFTGSKANTITAGEAVVISLKSAKSSNLAHYVTAVFEWEYH
jgi:hypothetical protein